MNQLKSSLCRLTATVSMFVAVALLVPALIATLGCAQAESSNWAQTSPLIEPEERVDAGYHLSAHADVAEAEAEAEDDKIYVDERRAEAAHK